MDKKIKIILCHLWAIYDAGVDFPYNFIRKYQSGFDW